jgi:GNAT superfamily N-acetyltransferase
MGIEISETTSNQFEAVKQLWESCGGEELFGRPLMILAAYEGEQLVGIVACDGTATGGYLGKVAVAQAHRESDVSQKLVENAIEKLRTQGIHRCEMDLTLALPDDNGAEQEKDPQSRAAGFWNNMHWPRPPELGGASHVVRVIGQY